MKPALRAPAGSSATLPVPVFASRRTRWLLLLLILVAFARLLWRVDAKSLWWDESLSLQRAESPFVQLLLGEFVFDDGITQTLVFDQHPPVYFLILGALLRLAGDDDFVLRFPSVVIATLLVPAAWVLARLLVRRRVLPPGAAWWAALLVAVNPFYLWYGREVRMYTLMPLLALISSYLLLRWWEEGTGPRARRYLVGYIASLVLLLGTHYLAFLILPIHVVVLFARQAGHSLRRAVYLVSGLLVAGLVIAAALARLILKTPGAGTNFAPVSLHIMARDLVNAFSMGLSVDASRAIWLDLIFAVLALLGALWALRPGRRPMREAWFLPLFVVAPVVALQIVQHFQPAYMNSRHLSLISGPFVLLVAGGLAVLSSVRGWLGVAVAAVLLAGTGYSTYNYYYAPEYAKDDFKVVGADLAAELQPGDGVLLVPTEMVRLYHHYLPLDLLQRTEDAIADPATEPPSAWQSAPEFGSPWEGTEARLQAMLARHRRVWLVASGMVPLSAYQKEAREWLSTHAFLARDSAYSSNTLLWLKLYLPQPPVLTRLPATVQHAVTAEFGGKVQLAGYDIGQPLSAESSTPVTLYWQPVQALDRHYKYILRWVTHDGAGAWQTLATTEREPYHGMLPTTLWGVGQTIMEYTELPPVTAHRSESARLRLALQVYDAETLEKLPVTAADPDLVTPDGQTLLLSYAP